MSISGGGRNGNGLAQQLFALGFGPPNRALRHESASSFLSGLFVPCTRFIALRLSGA